MSAFTDSLTVTELDKDWRHWRLEQPLIYEVGAEGSGRIILVPPGFVTDGASVPRLFWWLIPSWGKYSRAAVVHDYLCTMLVLRTPHIEGQTARACDAVFWEAMGVCKVTPVIRVLMYAAVRLAAILRLRKTSRIAP